MEFLFILGTSLFFSLILFGLLYWRFSSLQQNREDSSTVDALRLENQHLKEENSQLKKQRLLKSKHEEIEKLLWNAHKIQSFKNKLKKVIEQLNIDDSSKEKILLELNKEKLKSIDWSDVSDRFQHSFPGLIEQLKLKYPDLSSNDIRLIMLIKMDLNTKEIAAVLNLSEKSAEIAKYRLRKKLDLPKSKKINTLIDQLWQQ